MHSQSFKPVIVKALKNILPKEELERLSNEYENYANEILQTLKNPIVVEHAAQFSQFYSRIKPSTLLNPEILKEEMRGFLKDQKLDEKTCLDALEKHVNAVKILTTRGVDLYEYFLTIKEADYTNKRFLKAQLKPFFEKHLKSTKHAKQMTKLVVDRFVTMFKRYNEYSQIKQVTVLYAYEKLLQFKFPLKTDTIFLITDNLAEELDQFHRDVEKSADMVYNHISNSFFKYIEDAAAFFDESMENLERAAENENLETRLKEYVKKKCGPLVDEIIQAKKNLTYLMTLSMFQADDALHFKHMKHYFDSNKIFNKTLKQEIESYTQTWLHENNVCIENLDSIKNNLKIELDEIIEFKSAKDQLSNPVKLSQLKPTFFAVKPEDQKSEVLSELSKEYGCVMM